MQSSVSPKSNNQPAENTYVNDNDITSLLADLSLRKDKDILGHEAIRVLRTLWPSVFRVSSPKPLKIGIDKEIAATGKVPENIVRIGLRSYTRLEQYLENTIVGRVRIGLDGQPDGRVRLDEALNADMMLYARYCRKNPPRVFVGQFRLVKGEEVMEEVKVEGETTETETIAATSEPATID